MAGIYTIGSKLGYDLANGMKVGQSIRATDGSIWTKNLDGSISVQHNGENLQGVLAYEPQETDTVKIPNKAQTQATQRQESVAQMVGGSGYTSPYADDLKQVIAGLKDSKWEGWDKDSDPSYQAYRKEYLREADRTMQDTLAAYAQNTGGIAGSSAITAASQAADYYKSKLADAIPALHDSAYNRYLQDVAQKQNVASLLMNAESQAHSQYVQNISYALNKWAQMGYADQEVAGILGVAAGTPTTDQSYKDWSTAFSEQQYNDQLEAKAKAEADAKLQEMLDAVTVKPVKGYSGNPTSDPAGSELGTQYNAILFNVNAWKNSMSNQDIDAYLDNFSAEQLTLEGKVDILKKLGRI
ncbi:MAG: hypothetical protein J6J43_01205 [Oscillospiraceae bacterium]|nr:hypothetical protein [Oscillospiraceae bacterium]